MPYPYLGTTGRLYVQYRDTATWRPLEAEPGQSYDMEPVPGADGLAVPPSDGLWGEAEPEPKAAPKKTAAKEG